MKDRWNSIVERMADTTQNISHGESWAGSEVRRALYEAKIGKRTAMTVLVTRLVDRMCYMVSIELELRSSIPEALSDCVLPSLEYELARTYVKRVATEEKNIVDRWIV